MTDNPPQQTIAALEKARRIALNDPAHYEQLIPSILPVIGKSAPLQLQRWGAAFLAETFASPTVPSESKERLSLQVLPLMRSYLEEQPDVAVVRSTIQLATSIYPLVFKHTVFHENESVWNDMTAVKSNILKRDATSNASAVKVSCIKFIQRIVQVQTPGMIADPRVCEGGELTQRPEQNEVSLALIRDDKHAVLKRGNLQAEALGLLDRMLNVFNDPDAMSYVAFD